MMFKKANVGIPHYERDLFLGLKLKLKDICRAMDEKEMIEDYYEEDV